MHFFFRDIEVTSIFVRVTLEFHSEIPKSFEDLESLLGGVFGSTMDAFGHYLGVHWLSVVYRASIYCVEVF